MLRYPRADYDPETAREHFEGNKRFDFRLETDWPSVLKRCCDDEREDASFEDLVRARYRSVAYAFFYLRCGIYVRVRDGEVTLVPFANPEYRNDWMPGDLPFAEWSLVRHVSEKRKYARHYAPSTDIGTWWCNGGILCNEWDRRRPWGDTYLAHVLSLLRASFREGDDADFMFNKRDYPQLRRDSSTGRLLNPYGFVHDRELPERFQGEHLRFLSFYGSDAFEDRLVPTTDDIEVATGDLFPPHFSDVRSSVSMAAAKVPWSEKRDVAFFRGGATGSGVTVADNTRLHLASLADGDLLDAGVTAWNMRDKKGRNLGVSFLKPETLPFGLSPFVPVSEQQAYKYVVYADGHCAASRYGSMMKLGALILKVESRDGVPGSLWLDGHLKAGRVVGKKAKGIKDADHLAVCNDLSNLLDTIRWARGHDKQVRAIVKRCGALADRILAWDHLCEVVRSAALQE